ncbi:MAG: cytochrome c3 family protein [bacterium]
MKKFFSSIPESLSRLMIVFAVIIGLALLVRALLPAALKDTTLQREATVHAEQAKPIHFVGALQCNECHEQNKVKGRGYHGNLSCETCHGPGKDHIENPGEVKPELPRKREFCTNCHAYNPSRPTGFPQINPAMHNPLKPCISCHNPHDPKPPNVPQECEACHAEIARTKSLSSHVQLECSACHAVPREHKVTPRLVDASMPRDRAFCGKCHSKDSQVRDVPKVDIAAHGEKYLCWQCHYPHMPEVD